MRNIEALNLSDRFMDPLTRRVVRCQSLITSTMAHVKHHINRFREEHSLAQKLQKQVLETVCQSPFGTPKVEAAVVTPPTRTTTETDSDEQRRLRRDHPTEGHTKRSQSTRFSISESDNYAKRNIKSK